MGKSVPGGKGKMSDNKITRNKKNTSSLRLRMWCGGGSMDFRKEVKKKK